MQENSIHKPTGTANETTPDTFPRSGNNFVTLAFLPDGVDFAAWAEAHAFVEDCQVALLAFEEENTVD
ncbi:MAG: hypothetical protein CR977_02450 [Gammaproteobacteria bacterium]|nr:MAG: hypothetical protein CR977_02450 [Gammaproteobacteria bacterium]